MCLNYYIEYYVHEDKTTENADIWAIKSKIKTYFK